MESEHDKEVNRNLRIDNVKKMFKTFDGLIDEREDLLEIQREFKVFSHQYLTTISPRTYSRIRDSVSGELSGLLKIIEIKINEIKLKIDDIIKVN